MKKIILISLALVLSFSAFSQTEGFGLGAQIGTSVDFTVKLWMSEKMALAAATGFEYLSYGGFHVTGDLLFHNWTFDVAEDQMKVYFGPGLGLGVYLGAYYYSSNVWMTLRAPGGVGYYFHSMPLEAFVEVAPGLDLFGPWGVDFRWGSYVGARWYF
jgi:hypothetical protein